MHATAASATLMMCWTLLHSETVSVAFKPLQVKCVLVLDGSLDGSTAAKY